MGENSLLKKIIKEQENHKNQGSTVPNLIQRVRQIQPKELANALVHVESQENFKKLLRSGDAGKPDQTRLYFAKGLIYEMECIYLELAKHLRNQNSRAIELMNAIFDLFNKTIFSLAKLPAWVSMN